jgi:hypothetical protein
MGGGLYGDATGPANADSGQAYASNAWAIRVNPESASRPCFASGVGVPLPKVGTGLPPPPPLPLPQRTGARRWSGCYPYPVFSFNVVVLVEGRSVCGEPAFRLRIQGLRAARTLWDGAPEARGLQTTTSRRTLGLWMTDRLFKNSPQGFQDAASAQGGHGLVSSCIPPCRGRAGASAVASPADHAPGRRDKGPAWRARTLLAPRRCPPARR